MTRSILLCLLLCAPLFSADDLPEAPLSEDHQKLIEELGADFAHFNTEHFVVLHNTEPVWTQSRVSVLETTYDRFFEDCRAIGMQVEPPKERLICILFAQHADFAAYALRVDQFPASGFSGYYSGRTNRITFYDNRTNPEYRKVNDQITAGMAELPKIQKAMRAAAGNNAQIRQLRFQLNQKQQEIAWYRKHLNSFGNQAVVSTSIHEAVHQLAFNTGLQTLAVRFPFWFSEGLATSFETGDPRQAFGPAHDNLSRRKDLTEAFRAGRLMPLSDFVRVPAPFGSTEQIADQYAQAWGLFRFLYSTRQESLVNYLKALNASQGSEAAPELMFTQHFGELDALNSAWISFCKQQ